MNFVASEGFGAEAKTRSGKVEAPARNIYGFKFIYIHCSMRNYPGLKTIGAHSRIGCFIELSPRPQVARGYRVILEICYEALDNADVLSNR